jgi:uncharacterized integral membrane protein
MNVKTLFKTVFSTAMLVLLLLMGLHNRTTVDFSLLPLLNQSFHGPVIIMYFLFFAGGLLTGMVICIRSGRKEPRPGPANSAAHIGSPAPEPRVGSRIS